MCGVVSRFDQLLPNAKRTMPDKQQLLRANLKVLMLPVIAAEFAKLDRGAIPANEGYARIPFARRLPLVPRHERTSASR